MLAKNSMRTICFVLVVGSLILTGCLKTYQEIRLKSDLSGSISFQVVYDLEAVTKVLLMQGGMAQKMTPEQQKMMQEQIKMNIQSKNDEQKESIQNQLPEGITLKNFNLDESNPSQMKTTIELGFDHIRSLKKLRELKLSEGDEKTTGKMTQSQKLMENFSVEEQGDTIIIKQDVAKGPEGSQPKENANIPPEIKKILKEIGVYFKIRVPYLKYEVAEHTAQKYDKKNHTLLWAYSGETIMNQKEAIKPIYVKLVKKSK